MERLLSKKAVRDLIGFSFAHIYRFVHDPAYRHIGFPSPVQIGGRVFWAESEVQKWIRDNLDRR